ncbi:MAG: hypothetical protein AABZ11_07065 [Nitrospinota bacterium]
MKKILVGILVCVMIFAMSIPSTFAATSIIPFWQNGGNVSTLISIVAGGDTTTGTVWASTGATITITLTADDTSSDYTISPTTGAGAAAGTTGKTFATATFLATKSGAMLVDTAQISTTTSATVVWTTGAAYSSTAAKFGHGIISGTNGDHRAWVAVYGGTNPAGFSVAVNGGNAI